MAVSTMPQIPHYASTATQNRLAVHSKFEVPIPGSIHPNLNSVEAITMTQNEDNKA